MTLGIFANCIFCLKVKYLSGQQKKKLQADIKKNGGEFSFLLNPQCTHVILDDADILNQYQLNSIQKNHIHVTNPDFIWESVKERRLLDVKNYDPNKSPDTTPPSDQNGSSSEVKTDDLPMDNTLEKENTKVTEVCAENVEIPCFPQDFEVAKYNILEKVVEGRGQETVVVELQCSREPGNGSFMTSAHFLLADGSQTRRQFTVKQTSEDASEYYEHQVEELKRQGFLLKKDFTPEAIQLASEKLQTRLLEEVINSSPLSQEVSSLVEMIWREALGHLEYMLLKPVNRMSLNDVSKAEGILLLVKTALKDGETTEQLQKMMTEFYRLIPHRHPATEEINLRLLAKKEDLCQLIRDMLNVCETHLSKANPPSLAKYRALRCLIEHVEQNTEEFSRVKKEILQNNHRKSPVEILQIFKVGRANEVSEFLSKLGNVRPLLHGSPVRNIVGILARGLLLPKVVEDRGMQRTDVGNLGSGIYFSDSLSTCIKYSHPGETDGSRFLVICDVALGKCMDLFRKDFSLTEAPPGYDSVHGVSETASVPTDFQDDEFVVYKTNQVKIKYIVKFCMPGDQITEFHPHEDTELEEHRPEFSSNSEVEDYQLPDRKSPSSIKAGLQDASGNLIPLKNVHIKGRIMDFIAQVVVFQTYTNQSHVPIEAKYTFPLDDKAAVCGFEAFINEKHVVGEIKEKEEAQRIYGDAVSQGHGAYLMDQDSPDVFTVSVGNLPPWAEVLIKITYITELSIQGTVAVFFLPTTVAPWQQDKALNENLQDTVETICVKEIGAKQSFSLTVSIEMPHVIASISSDTHQLKQKRTDCKAVISTVKGSSLDKSGFSLHIGLSDPYLPRMWVEKHPEKESEACMLVFQPDLKATLTGLGDKNEVIICLDCSNSMEGVTFVHAKQIALYALSLVGEKQKVNIMQFGTGYKELFSYPKHITSKNIPTEFIMSAAPTMGNTDLWKMLLYLSFLYPSQGLRNILLISDGHLQSESLTLQLVKRNAHHTRLFTCGVGSTANHHILRTLSQCGAGVFEYFNSKSKHSWKKQIEAQMIRLHSPSFHSVSVKWQQLSRDAPEPLQAPACVPSLFHNDRLLVYGFIPHCTQATLCALVQEKEFCTMVSTTELQKTTGTMIHKLAARALIRDYEDGILHHDETNHEMKKKVMKSLIIKLSKENSIMTQFTSFVAVEKRDHVETPFTNIPNILELIAQEDVDILPYMSWQEEQPEATMYQPFSVSFEGNKKQLRPRLAKRNPKKLPMRKVSEKVDVGTLTSQEATQPITTSFECKDVETKESQMDSLKEEGFKGLMKTSMQPKMSASPLSFASAAAAPRPLVTPWNTLSAFPSAPGNAIFQTQGFGSPAPFRSKFLPKFGPPKLGQGLEPDSGILCSSQPGSGARNSLGSGSLPTPPLFGSSFGSASGCTFSDSSSNVKHPDLCKPVQDPNMRLFSAITPKLHSPPRPTCFTPPRFPPLLTSGFSLYPQSLLPLHLQSSSAAPSTNDMLRMDLPELAFSSPNILAASPDSIHKEAWDDSTHESFFETESDGTLYKVFEKMDRSDVTSDSPLQDEGNVICRGSWRDCVPWTSLFNLQTEDGFWKLTPELGLILNLNTNVLYNFLEEKGIRSLGMKGRECLLDLIATLLVLQFLRTRLEQKGMVFKSLMKLDDFSMFRNIPWAFENIKKASDWARRTEGQYPSICQRLELGKDWESASKQLLGIQLPENTSLHRILHYIQG